MKYRFTPYSWLTLSVVATGFAVIAFGMSWGFFGSFAAFDMRDVIVQARNHALIALFLPVGWLGVWAARVHGSASVIVGPAPGRSRRRIVAGQVVPLAVSAGVGWLVGWAPVCVVALAGQYWTPVDLVAMITVGVGVCSLVAIGFLVAALFGLRAGAFIVPIVMLAVMLLPGFVIDGWLGGEASSVALSYVWPVEEPDNGEQLVVGTEVIRLVFYLLVAFTATMAASGLAEFRSTRRTPALRAAGWLTFPLVVAVAMVLIRPLLWVDDPQDQPYCQEDEQGVTLCLYQIDEPQRDQIRGAIAPMLALMPAGRLDQIKITEDDWQPDGIYLNALRDDRAAWLGNEVPQLARNLFLPSGGICEVDDGGEVDQEQDALQMSILKQVGVRAAALTADPLLSDILSRITEGYFATSELADERLSRLTDAEFRDWYASVADRVNKCDLTEEDLP